MKTKEYTYESRSGLCRIKAWQWYPDNDADIKAVLQIHHGMAEHCGRYAQSVKAFTDMGYAVFMNDMLNHGQSNSKKEQLGYFGENNGYKDIIADAKSLMDIAKGEYPDKPYVICGHSMGSMVMRCFINEYGNCFDGAVFIGTSGNNPLAGISILLTDLIAKFKGGTYKSEFVKNAGFGSYNKHFEKRTDCDWLSRDRQSVDAYLKDELCGFTFSVRGYKDLARLITECNTDAWAANINSDMPVLLVSGSMDPVGNYGKGIKDIYERLIKTGHKNAEMKLFEDARHEVLNEHNKEDAYDFINKFIERKVLVNRT